MTVGDEDTAPTPARRWTRVFTRRNGRPRRPGRVLLAVCVLVAAMIGAGVPIYVLPQIDPLRRADAVFVLGGPEFDRYPYGLSLGAAGWAPTVVLSNPYGSDNAWLTRTCATRQTGFQLECFVPDPPTTKGEARQLRRLAAERGWQTVIVVTFRTHISRARFIVQQCFDGDLVMAMSPPELHWYQWISEYAYQTAGYARAALQYGC